jgi:uncharacterized Zn finger protein
MEDDKRRQHEEVMQIKRDLINYAQTTWGQEWIKSILKTGRPYRMQRGILYAQDEERISNLRINKGHVFAMVQGTAPTPYRVNIYFKTIPDDVWRKIINQLTNKALNLIKLLEGELPMEIIDIFEKNNYSFFLEEIKTEDDAKCSCPDKAIPCKHIAATILYIAHVLDFYPFILLQLRGKTKEELLNELSLAEELEGKEDKKAKEHIESSFDIPKLSIKDMNLEENYGEEISQIGFKFKKPGKIIETLENIGLPKNLDNPKAFASVLNSIYHAVTAEIYKLAMVLEKSHKKR